MPESAYGPTNQCIGIGDVLLKRGHRVVFAAEASWSGRLKTLGFEEDLVDLAPPPENADGQEVSFGKTSLEILLPSFENQRLNSWKPSSNPHGRR